MRTCSLSLPLAFLAASLSLVCSFSANGIVSLRSFVQGPSQLLGRQLALSHRGQLVAPSLRGNGPQTSLVTMMAKGKKKGGKKSTKTKTRTKKAPANSAAATAPASAAPVAAAAPPPEASSTPVAPPLASSEASSAPASPPHASEPAQVIPKAARVDDDGQQDDALMAKANEALNAAKAALGDGVGIGGGEVVSFTGEDGKQRSMPKNHLYGITGDATVVKATSKTLTVRLEGKFWGSRAWAFSEVQGFFKEEMPGMKVVVEESSQLMDLYLSDVWFDKEAWEVRYEGPQYVNERGVQVAQPFNADGTMAQADFDEDALKAGIEEMMVDALQQSQGTFLDSAGYEDINRQLAMSQTAYLEESDEVAEMAKEDDNIISVTKFSSPDQGEAKPLDMMDDKVGASLKGNPMFEKMADALEQEPGAIEDMMKLLDASNGNLFAVMSNPKFQSLAQKMMANPELMQMMQDPELMKQAMSSAQDIGLTDALGVKPNLADPSTAAKGFADKASDAIKSGLGMGAAAGKEVATPDWMQRKEAEVRERASKMQEMSGSAVQQVQQEQAEEQRLQDEIRRAREGVPPAPEKEAAAAVEDDEDNFSFQTMLEESRNDAGAAPVGSGSAGLSDAAKENLLYAGGFVFGVGGIFFFFATQGVLTVWWQLGVIDVPFMKNLGSVSTPAAQRLKGPPGGAQQGGAAEKVVDVQDETPF